MTQSIVWCIGGVDTSGGAGITRDLITLADLGTHGCAISTLVAAQTNSALLCTQPTSASCLNEQWQALASEDLPDAIKIGAIADDAQALLLCARLECLREPKPFVVWDPVLTTTSGGALSRLSNKSIQALLSYVDIITPNTDELGVLTQHTVNDEKSFYSALQSLLTLGAKAIFAKGGHANWQPQATDTYITPDTRITFSQPRNLTGSLRGTGCMLASALCAFKVKGYAIADALTLANAYLKQVRVASLAHSMAKPNSAEQTPSTQPGTSTKAKMARTVGFPTAPNYFPSVCFGETDPVSHFHHAPFPPLSTPKQTSVDLGIYPVVDDVTWITKLLPTGVNIIQLRVKTGTKETISAQIKQAVALTKHSECKLFINDYWELAIEHGAYGVHLGQEDLASANLTAIRKAGLRLGVSTHGYAEIQRIKMLKPSYIALGHIFPTATKIMPSKPQGVERLAEYVALCEGIPTVAIGGINLSRVKAVAQTGVNSIAVVTAITQAANPFTAYYALAKEAGFVN
jgi:hydroxymethylpyrimidine kinase/phosphomethylpyrimidine kinase/thiamine-phosphate diphosphorylase